MNRNDRSSRILRHRWNGMFQRCYNERGRAFKNYGGRGIRVWSGWWRFEAFERWALSHGYHEGLTLERRDNDGNYHPNNCLWVPHAAQRRNQRRVRLITAYGESKILTDWARDPRCGISGLTIERTAHRINMRLQKGWSFERALTTPSDYRRNRDDNVWVTAFGEKRILMDWVRDPRCRIGHDGLRRRLKLGWEPEAAIITPPNKKAIDAS